MNNDNQTAHSAMNPLELTSINALIAYAAHERKVSEDLIRETVSKSFGVEAVSQLPQQSYDAVIKYLIDVQIQLILN